MGWDNSTRRERLPANWSSLRLQVLRRDNYRCVADVVVNGKLQRCVNKATEVDHIIPNDNDELSNLRSLCHRCHAKKTHGEATKANALKRKRIHRRFRRAEEVNPGLVEGKALKAKPSTSSCPSFLPVAYTDRG